MRDGISRGTVLGLGAYEVRLAGWVHGSLGGRKGGAIRTSRRKVEYGVEKVGIETIVGIW